MRESMLSVMNDFPLSRITEFSSEAEIHDFPPPENAIGGVVSQRPTSALSFTMARYRGLIACKPSQNYRLKYRPKPGDE